jgi:hypothetical protein
MKSFILMSLSLCLSLRVEAGDLFNPFKEAAKLTEEPYSSQQDINCEELLRTKEELRSKREIFVAAKKSGGDKKELKRLEKDFEQAIRRDQQQHAYYFSRAILFERISGNKAIPYDETIHGVWNAEKICRMYKDDYKDHKLSQVMLMHSQSKAATKITTMSQRIQFLEESLRHCEEDKAPGVTKSSRGSIKNLSDDVRKLNNKTENSKTRPE